MAFKDVFRGLFVIEDEDNVEIEQEKQEQKERPVRNTTTKPVVKEVVKPEKRQYIAMEKKMPKQNVVNMKQEAEVSSKVCLFEPRVFSDTQDIADELKNRRAILVNLQRIDKVSAKRIIDFLSGTVYAIGGDIQRIGQDIFLCTPDNVEVAGSISEVIETEEPMEERVDDDV